MFSDRTDAGKQLGRALDQYKNKGVLVCAIPRGGVEVGVQVAEHLHADFSIVISRKLPFPFDPECGFGAIAEDGNIFLYTGHEAMMSTSDTERIIAEQKEEIKRRIEVLRKGQPLPSMYGRTVILVDDGIAMGSTMRVSVALCRGRGAERVVVAVPVTGRERTMEIGDLVDEIVVLEMPIDFRAVAQVYLNWYDVTDREVVAIIQRWEEEDYG